MQMISAAMRATSAKVGSPCSGQRVACVRSHECGMAVKLRKCQHRLSLNGEFCGSCPVEGLSVARLVGKCHVVITHHDGTVVTYK